MTVSALFRNALLLGASVTFLAGAHAQNECPAGRDMADTQLQGRWSGSVEGQPGSVRIELGPHPDRDGTAKGYIFRGDARLPMVGDVDDGTVTLEESADGVHITGTWLGQVVDGSCGREIRGDYLRDEQARPSPFVLRKQQPLRPDHALTPP